MEMDRKSDPGDTSREPFEQIPDQDTLRFHLDISRVARRGGWMLLLAMMPAAVVFWWIDEIAYCLLLFASLLLPCGIEIYHAHQIGKWRRKDRLTMDARGIAFVSASAFRASWQISWTDIQLPVLYCKGNPGTTAALLSETGALALLTGNGACRLDLLRLWRTETGEEEARKLPPLYAIERHLQALHPAAECVQKLDVREFLQRVGVWRLERVLHKAAKPVSSCETENGAIGKGM
jgi:hypothetical protein